MASNGGGDVWMTAFTGVLESTEGNGRMGSLKCVFSLLQKNARFLLFNSL